MMTSYSLFSDELYEDESKEDSVPLYSYELLLKSYIFLAGLCILLTNT